MEEVIDFNKFRCDIKSIVRAFQNFYHGLEKLLDSCV